ncbi:5-formyltetrahydrofolate cyclo-ligase [Proteiniclasticum sp. SCR006]|uniref:5-formyltetrahydrofolate cyclo-ligase n=1 Tax=Proteiniclasticum aestuarii TaxID=2817862 RepID=A0A939KEP0_9CLOT|nr:5-formyltetrahydrofolate cyclo-ligase [Proteiniclasticum aestuarii]MBO1263622.1 5-formyltetrahydrofolate cyclo-ligase [Proteiniclasticum aestuarii]
MLQVDPIIRQEKKELRKELIERLKSLDGAYRKEASEKMLNEIITQKDYLLAGTIFIYVGTEIEVDTSLIIKDALAKGKKVVVPKTIELGHMEACEIDSMEDLHPGRHGILEPENTLYRLEPDKIDVAFIPCVAYTGEGYRLGYGGGFYDRFLPRGKFKRILLAFGAMEVKKLPVDHFDEKVQGILTEKGYVEV